MKRLDLRSFVIFPAEREVSWVKNHITDPIEKYSEELKLYYSGHIVANIA